MNKLKLLLASILCSTLMVTGCSFNNGSSSGSSSEPGISEPSEPEADPVLQGIAITGEYKTEYEVGEEFDATGIIVTASYDKGEPKDVTAETVFSGFDSSVAGPIVVTATYLEKTAEINLTVIEHVYSAEEVAADINAVFNPLVGGDILDWYEDYGCYIGGLNFGEATATTDEDHVTELQDKAAIVYSYLPEYLELAAAEYESADDDYYVGLEANGVGVDLFSYVNGSGNIIVQIQIYDIVEE